MLYYGKTLIDKAQTYLYLELLLFYIFEGLGTQIKYIYVLTEAATGGALYE